MTDERGQTVNTGKHDSWSTCVLSLSTGLYLNNTLRGRETQGNTSSGLVWLGNCYSFMRVFHIDDSVVSQ